MKRRCATGFTESRERQAVRVPMQEPGNGGVLCSLQYVACMYGVYIYMCECVCL